VRVLRRSDLVDAEDTDWMQDVARILCLGDTGAGDALAERWRDAVAHPDPDDFGWDTEDPDFDPDTLELYGDDNDLTLYWQHLLAIAPQFARWTGRMPTAWPAASGCPAPDWQWDRATQGDGMQDGLDSLAQHLGAAAGLAAAAHRQRLPALCRGAPGRCSPLLERLAQAAVSAWVHEV
jgi:hypothetical protein